MIVYTVTVIALEVPTGGLADTIGTRAVLVVGTLLADRDVRRTPRRGPCDCVRRDRRGARRRTRAPLGSARSVVRVRRGRTRPRRHGHARRVARRRRGSRRARRGRAARRAAPTAGTGRVHPQAADRGRPRMRDRAPRPGVAPRTAATSRPTATRANPPQAPSSGAACGSPRRIATCAACWSRPPRSGAGSRASSCSGSRASRASCPRRQRCVDLRALRGRGLLLRRGGRARRGAGRRHGTSGPRRRVRHVRVRPLLHRARERGRCRAVRRRLCGELPVPERERAVPPHTAARRNTECRPGDDAVGRLTGAHGGRPRQQRRALPGCRRDEHPVRMGCRGRHRHRVDGLATAASTHARSLVDVPSEANA